MSLVSTRRRSDSCSRIRRYLKFPAVKRALVLVAVLAGDAAGHGRDPYAVHIEHRAGNEQDVIAGMSIGLVRSRDGGATWRWTCEEAVHYTDPFDPDYALSAAGSVLVQTRIGAGIDHTGCHFEATTLASTIVSAVAAASNGALYIAAADPVDSRIYKSIDDGTTFLPIASPGESGDWWTSIEVARSDPQRIYLSGYRFLPDSTRQFLMFVSRNGGATFTAMSTSQFVVSRSGSILIAGVGANPDVVYARVSLVTDAGGDAIYRSVDAGASWTQIFSSQDVYGLAFLARQNGELVAATRTSGAWRSADGTTWTELANAPHISALAETATGEVWAGTQNYPFNGPMGLPPIPGDGYALMKSVDLATWTPVMRLQDLGPPACAPGTDAHQQCVVAELGLGTPWCCLVGQLGITSTEIDCTGPRSCGYDLSGDMNPDVTDPPKPSCRCNGSGDGSWLLLVVVVGAIAARNKRAVPRRTEARRR